jgi:pimeloyl-ACP methyl ester carboxylesterase
MHRFLPARHLAIALAAALALAGCASTNWVELRESPKNPLVERLSLLSRGGPKPSERTMQLLRRYDLDDRLSDDRFALLAQLDQINDREHDREVVYAIAELSYLGAVGEEGSHQGRALELYGSAVTHAFEYLFDDAYPIGSNPYDPQFRGACDLYNTALEGTLRLVREQGALRPGTSLRVQTPSRICDVKVVLHSNGWRPDDFDQFEFVSDYSVKGLRNHYHGYGLGVPLIAIRRHQGGDPKERFYPERLAFPITAFLRVLPPSHEPWPRPAPDADGRQGSQPGGQPLEVVLELHDPLTSGPLAIAGRPVPLETDLSTPLAFFLNQPSFDDGVLSNLGLFSPDKAQNLTGLYMLEPYQEGKIPVVMVHGLWSSPVTWMEMFNDLRGDPVLREHYQYWFYLYPSGKPFWLSAAQFREDLAEMRSAVDPRHRQPALDHMVLVGHSMGGLVSKLQTTESGNDFWQTMSDRPFGELQAEEDVRAKLAHTFFFHANPSVRRVITIGTPHRGSHFANDLTRWLSHKLIGIPGMLMQSRQQIVTQNPDYFRDEAPLDVATSIDSLSPDSPLLPVLLAADSGPWVTYHNIVGQAPKDDIIGKLTAKFGSEGDGVVSLASAQLENAASQIVVPADHVSVHRHPQSILEVRRVLLAHLRELKTPSATPAGAGDHAARRPGEADSPPTQIMLQTQSPGAFAAGRP